VGQLLQLHKTPQIQRGRQRNRPSRHSRFQEEIRLLLVDPCKHPRRRLNKQLNEALDGDLYMLKYFFSRLIQRLSGSLHVLKDLFEATCIRQRGRGNNGLRIQPTTHGIQRRREAV